MKKFKTWLSIGALLAVAVGCSTTKEKENMLSAAGFQMVPANTPQTQAHLKSLPADKITTAQRDGKMYYTFPDPKSNVLYVGQEPQYQRYQKMRLESQLPEERVYEAEITDDWAGWGSWGRW